MTHDPVLAGKCQRQLHMQAGELKEVFTSSSNEQAALKVG